MSRLFIVNSLSERVATKGSTLAPLAEETGTRLFYLDPFDDLPSAVKQAALDGVNHVVIEGGDGTVQGVISAFLMQSDRFADFPKFTIVPGGMTNQVAKNIGLKSSKLNAVRAALKNDLTPYDIPLLNIVDRDGRNHAGFLFSTGAMPQITRYTTSQLHRKGIGGSLAVLGGILKGMRGNDETLMNSTHIAIDGVHKGDHLGTVITTLPSLILKLDPFWGEGNGPLRTTLVDGKYRHLARNILSIWMGRKHIDRSANGFHSGRYDSLSFDYKGDIVLDGEFLSIPSGKFTVRPTRPVTFLR